jgi:hypothetical protein
LGDRTTCGKGRHSKSRDATLQAARRKYARSASHRTRCAASPFRGQCGPSSSRSALRMEPPRPAHPGDAHPRRAAPHFLSSERVLPSGRRFTPPAVSKRRSADWKPALAADHIHSTWPDCFRNPREGCTSIRTGPAQMFHEIRREQSSLQNVTPALSQGQCSVPEHPSRTGQEAARVARGGLFSFRHQKSEQPRSIELHPRKIKPSLIFRL